LRACLGAAGAAVIEGPKACGKTRLAQQLAASTVLLDVDLAARQALAVDPALVLAGRKVDLVAADGIKENRRPFILSSLVDVAP